MLAFSLILILIAIVYIGSAVLVHLTALPRKPEFVGTDPVDAQIARSISLSIGFLAVLLFAGIDSLGFGVIPAPCYIAANLMIGAGILARRWTLRRIVVAVAVLALSFSMTFSGLSSLGHRLEGIRPGMTVEEVYKHMEGYKIGTGLVDPYTQQEFIPDGTLIFREPDARPGDQTWGMVTIQNGRVVSTHVSPD